MKKLRTILLCLVVAFGGVAFGKDKGLHIPQGRNVNWNWNIGDGAGFNWQITSYGYVQNGTNNAYDSGMQLQVNGSSFSWGSSGWLSKDGREVEIGPWTSGSVKVYRRIYVDKKLGYCRWIDIFENPTQAKQTLTLRYYSNMGGSTRQRLTTSGKAELTPADWGLVTDDSSSSRPAVVHVFATKGTKTKPRMECSTGNDNIYHHMTLNIPARKTVAVCLFEAQRNSFSTATKFLKNFNPSRELRKVPSDLRRIIVNMGGGVLTLGTLELPRHDKHDLAVLQNGDELLGSILNERFVVETFYGRLDLPADQIAGIAVPALSDPHVRVGLIDGQVVAGKLLTAPLRLKLNNGNEMSIKMKDLSTAAYKLSPERPEQITVKQPVMVLRGGQQLFFSETDLPLDFQTEHGQLKLRAQDLRAIYFDTVGGGLHRVEFGNRSVLSGLLLAEEFSLKLNLGPTLNIPRHLASRVMMPTSSKTSSERTTLTLRNDDVLKGRITDEAIVVRTDSGSVTVASDDIAQMTFKPPLIGPVQLKLHGGTTVSGTLVKQTIGFQIDPGPQLDVFIGHITEIICPKPPANSDGTTSTTPESAETQPAASEDSFEAKIRETKSIIAEERARREAVKAKQAKAAAAQKAADVARAALKAKGG